MFINDWDRVAPCKKKRSNTDIPEFTRYFKGLRKAILVEMWLVRYNVFLGLFMFHGKFMKS